MWGSGGGGCDGEENSMGNVGVKKKKKKKKKLLSV